MFSAFPESTFAQKPFKIVIDAGHGGKDPGRPNKSGIKEKNIVLNIALDLGKKLKNSGNEVIYTRDKDVFLTLRQRAKIANDVDADLFISIHCNAFHDSSVHGSETFVYGLHVSQANFNIAKKENEINFIDDHYLDDEETYSPTSTESVIKPGLTELVNQILPQVQLQIEAVMKNAEIVLQNINTLFDDETKKELKSSIEDFSNLTSSLSETSDEISKLIANNSENLTNSLADFRSASNNIKSITDSLNTDDINSITINLNSLVNNLNSITTSLKNSEGTAGKLINDKSIYDNLENATNQLNRLIEDIKLNPNRYINFSVFGKKNK